MASSLTGRGHARPSPAWICIVSFMGLHLAYPAQVVVDFGAKPPNDTDPFAALELDPTTILVCGGRLFWVGHLDVRRQCTTG